ncbi:MAG: UPF0182 family protein [Kineosporiaceae bacterium]
MRGTAGPPGRRRGALAPTLAVLGVLVVLLLGLASVWTDVLWYSQLGFTEVYRTRLLTEAGLFIVAAGLTAGSVYAAMAIAYRSRPVYAPVAVDTASLERYRETIEPLRRLVTIAVPAALGLFAGSAASQRWETFQLWWNRVPFDATDAQFGKDIGFFVFTLPWLQFLVGLFTMISVLAALVSVVTHYLYGGLRLQGPGPRLTSVARIQLSVIATAFLLLRAVDYWIGRYAMTTKQATETFTGLTYTDAEATLSARAVLAAIAAIIAILFLVGAFVDRWRMLPLYGVVLLVISAILIGGIYPAVVQRFRVNPSPQSYELPYIKNNIEATRAAYGLDQVKSQAYKAQTEASPQALRNDADSIPGIRLLDPALVSDTFKQLQQNKQYYQFADALDVDRYTVDGKARDSVVAVRELNLGGVPIDKRNWFNDHFVYTHGFGLVAAYGNEPTADGKPTFFEGGIPVRSTVGDYEPRVYFGEKSLEYSIVGGPPGSTPRELDYPDDNSATQQKNTTYAGEGGVAIGSLLRRTLYALKFREQNILLSKGVTDQSRIMYDRTPRERVEKVAPYLTLDGDPYPSIVDGRIVWILDGYTTSNRYPYSLLSFLDQATADSLTANATSVAALAQQQVNYIRNSVKATVDAYDGSVRLYAWDEKDPVLAAWRKVFPTSVKPLAAIGGDLMSHLRYPEDLFKVQRTLLARYHVTDPSAFFSAGDFWQVPPEPNPRQGATVGGVTAVLPRQPPFYLSIQMPGQDAPRYSLTSTFIPPTTGRNTLKGFLAVDADAGNEPGKRRADYGTMRLLQLPTDAIKGPGQMQNDFNSNTIVSGELNILQGTGGASAVEKGNLLTLPMAGGLLYVQPVYIRSKGETTYPVLRRVLVGYGDKIGFAPTLDAALNQVFGTSPLTAAPGTGGTGGTGASPSPGASPATGGADARAALQQALSEAQRAVQDSDAALKAGDFTKYGEAQKRLKDAIARAVEAQQRLGVTTSSATVGPTGSPKPSASATPSATP